jgi:kynurenine formamidase
MKRTLAALAAAAAAGCAPQEPPPLSLLDGTWIDLTHDFAEDTVYWPTADTFELEVLSRQRTEAGFFYAANNYAAAEHGGTHVDAPIHFAEDRWTLAEIPLERLIGPGVVVDVSRKAAADRDYLVTVADLEEWEARHGRIPDGAIVLLHTGFARYWPERVRYMGTDARGEEGVAGLHFPGLAPEAARWLVAERAPNAVGLDTPSIDHGPSKNFESHVTLHTANVAAFENVANLDRVPAAGAVVVALPMKIRDGSGGPLRIAAFVPNLRR